MSTAAACKQAAAMAEKTNAPLVVFTWKYLAAQRVWPCHCAQRLAATLLETLPTRLWDWHI
jgi:hypothetical protein